ncbi:MAG: pyridoxamine 5'-phosphate oxidase, partial [Chlamydiales bacterium]|nr:pyridoxamine 5'-phosphate oxidase [Chlamydiales bacterium]
ANAAILATVDNSGRPSTRTVLIKQVSKKNGLLFFTNYDSNKAYDISHSPYVALTFYWRDIPRQCHVKGAAKKADKELSEKYFQKRPFESQLASYTSKQSQKIDSRQDLEEMLEKNRGKFQENKAIPRPSFWGGYWITPYQFEFWQGRKHRFHDRFVYEPVNSSWKISRLQP